MPAEVVMHVTEERLQVLDDEDELLVQSVRGIQHGGAGVPLGDLLPPARRQRVPRVAQLPGQPGVVLVDLVGQMEHGLQPEVGETEDLLALFHEPDRQQRRGEVLVAAQFGRDPREQHRLAAPARSDHQDVLARGGPDAAPEVIEQEAEFVMADHELLPDLLVRLEQAGVELADGGGGVGGHG